jgi:hypothetical protein
MVLLYSVVILRESQVEHRILAVGNELIDKLLASRARFRKEAPK